MPRDRNGPFAATGLFDLNDSHVFEADIGQSAVNGQKPTFNVESVRRAEA